MREILVLILAAALAVSLIAIAEAASITETESLRKARITEKEIDFGEIEQGKSKTMTVKIENLGDVKLEIKKLDTNCTCLIPSVKNKIVKPGESQGIEIKFDSAGMKPSRLVKYVLVKYAYVKPNDNDRKVRSIPVTCSATIIPFKKPMLQLEPYEVDLGIVNPGETVTKRVVYKNVGAADLEVEPILYLDRRFKITRNIQKKKLPPPKDGEDNRESQDFFQFSFEAKTPGNIDSFIIIRSNSAGGSYSKVAVTGEVADKSISITGFELSNLPPNVGAPQPKGDRYNINLNNFYSPYKVKITVLNGRSKGRTFTLNENITSRRASIILDPDEPGKVVSLQLDIIIEEPPPKKPEETGTPEEKKPADGEGPEEKKPDEGEETGEEKPGDAEQPGDSETPEDGEAKPEVKPSDADEEPEGGKEEDAGETDTPEDEKPEKPPAGENEEEEGEGEGG